VKSNLNDNYSVCSFVKPGVNIATQISSMTVDINLLTKNDLIIFWGGSNNVSRNNSQEGFKHLENFVNQIISLEYSMIDVNKYCKDQDTEICMLNLKTTSFSSHIMVAYRAPTGNFIGHLLATLTCF
jgi:hypothetical protein